MNLVIKDLTAWKNALIEERARIEEQMNSFLVTKDTIEEKLSELEDIFATLGVTPSESSVKKVATN